MVGYERTDKNRRENRFKKHQNDVFRLLINVSPTSRIGTSQNIQDDVIQFIDQIKHDKPDLKNLGITGTSFDDMLAILEGVYL